MANKANNNNHANQKKTLTLKPIKLEEITGRTKRTLTILRLKDNFLN